METGLNWVGSKRPFMAKISMVLSYLKHVDLVIDPMCGSGNLALGLPSSLADVFVLGDLSDMGPRYAMALEQTEGTFTELDVRDLLSKFGGITDKEHYYLYREWWNKVVYPARIWEPRTYLLSTVLLMKMCSNSMVRFNSDGEFNQGFRGIHSDEASFFSDTKISNLVKALNTTLVEYRRRKCRHVFVPGLDFEDLIDQTLWPGSSALVLLDPPYLVNQRVYMPYSMEDRERVINRFLELSKRPKTTVVLFAYLGVHDGIDELAKHFQVNSVNVVGRSGQSRILPSKEVDEVMITARNGL